jgi:hypothetical protein
MEPGLVDGAVKKGELQFVVLFQSQLAFRLGELSIFIGVSLLLFLQTPIAAHADLILCQFHLLFNARLILSLFSPSAAGLFSPAGLLRLCNCIDLGSFGDFGPKSGSFSLPLSPPAFAFELGLLPGYGMVPIFDHVFAASLLHESADLGPPAADFLDQLQ